MEENKVTVEYSQHVKFDSTAETKITNTDEIGMLINDLFHAVFADYYGCSLTVQYQQDLHMNIIVPKLFFRIKKKEEYSDDNLYAFKTLGTENTDNMVGRVLRVSQSVASGVKVFMTDEAKQVLEEFMITPNGFMKPGKLDWNTCFNVISTDADTYAAVFKLDIVKLITKIFGDKDDATGERLYYQIVPMYPVSQGQYKTLDKWALNVMKLNSTNQMNAAEKVGLYMPTSMNGPVAITATSNG